MTGFLRGLADPALWRAIVVLVLLFWAQPSLPLVLLALYFFLQGEFLAHGYRQERERLTLLLACLDDVEAEYADDEAREHDVLMSALLSRWPEQRH